jgi:hypothetical protein
VASITPTVQDERAETAPSVATCIAGTARPMRSAHVAGVQGGWPLVAFLFCVICLGAVAACGGSADTESSEGDPSAGDIASEVVASLPDEGPADLDAVRETLEGVQESDPDNVLAGKALDYLGVVEEQPLVTGEVGAVDRAAAERLRSSPPDRSLIPDPVRRYAPVVAFHPDEWLWPLDASLFLGNSTLMWAHEDCESAGVARGSASEGQESLPLMAAERLGGGGYANQAGCGAAGGSFGSDELTRPHDTSLERLADLPATEGFFLELDDEYRAGDLVARESGEATGVSVYFDYEPGRYVTYWFLYGGSAAPVPDERLDSYVTALAHEGDWERVSVRLNADNEATHMFYAQHLDGEELAWDDVVTADGTHPFVYAALGTHASYPSAGVTELACPLADVCVYDVAEGSESEWQTLEHLRAVSDEPWFGFGGAWGTNWPRSELSGPLGPSRHKQSAPNGW